jgi:transposase-like protein
MQDLLEICCGMDIQKKSQKPVAEGARELDSSPNTLHDWIK